MKTINYRRYRRRHPSTPDVSPKKHDAGSFFGETSSMFFQPIVPHSPTVVQRQAAPEKEDAAVQAKADKVKEEGAVMRAAAQEPEEEKENVHRQKKDDDRDKVSRKETGTATAGTAHTSRYIGTLQGGGKPLPDHARHFFAARMGHDFGRVRIHTDTEAARSAHDLHAKAYTVGSNIVFNDGQYNVESTEGRKLMAHELTHVIQQGKASS